MPVHFETDGPVAVVTIDRPEVANAIDAPTAQELADGFRRFDADESLSVAVLTGAHGKFCAGADLKAIHDFGSSTSSPGPASLAPSSPAPSSPSSPSSAPPSSATSGEAAGGVDAAARRVTRVAPDGDGPVGPTRMLLGKPVIAAVEGHAVAGGLELALWCDLRIAAADATFGVYCRRWGVPLMDGGTVRLARLIGHGRALDMILTGRGVGADEALQMGLANRVVPPGQALAAAVELAHRLAALPQTALRHDRLSSYEQWTLPLPDALLNEYEHGMAALSTGETFAGVARYARGDWRPGQFL
jgi:enoyl-CoA hydratase